MTASKPDTVAEPIGYLSAHTPRLANLWWPLVVAALGFTWLGGCFCIGLMILQFNVPQVGGGQWTLSHVLFGALLGGMAIVCFVASVIFIVLLMRHSVRTL